MKRTTLTTLCLLLSGAAFLHAQTPIITSVYGEAGPNTPVCPGGVAFMQGTNLSRTIPVTVGTRPVYIISAFTSTQLQFQLPVDAPVGTTTIRAGTSAPLNITLVQYCPGMPTSNPPGSQATAFHLPSGTPVTTGFPATPNELIAVSATGLGSTNPVFATGTSPDDDSVPVVTKPTVNLAGRAITPSRAYLQPHNPGFYMVEFKVPGDITIGNQNLSVSIGGLTSNVTMLPTHTGPVISQVTNGASYITAGPRRGIAQGSIFVVKGLNMGPATISIASNAFQSTTLSGTSVTVAVSGTAYPALMYYTSATQIAALLPSNTPAGTATIAVTYNGQTGPSINITVIANELGIFTVSSDGEGVGIVTFPDYSLVSTTRAANCGGVYTTCGAANPGDVLIIWATGLGPITGSDASGAGLGVNMSSLPLTVWLGDQQTTASYQGRSGCCIGEDQIVFTVAPNTPTGCAVPLTVQIGNSYSNTVALAVAATGSRTCTPVNPAWTTANVTQTAGAGPVTYGSIELARRDLFLDTGSPGFQDKAEAGFFRVTIPPAAQPFFMSLLDSPPLGTCQVYNALEVDKDPPLDSLVRLNAGPQFTVQNANGSRTIPTDEEGYGGTLSSTGNYLSPGPLTVSFPGGPDIPAFSATITIPTPPTMTVPQPDVNSATTIARSGSFTVTWTGGTPDVYIELEGYAPIDSTFSSGTSFRCLTSAATGAFVIPARILGALPPSTPGLLKFRALTAPLRLNNGLNLSALVVRFSSDARVMFQ